MICIVKGKHLQHALEVLDALMHQACAPEREREKLHDVHSASLAYEDGSMFMSGPFAEWL